mmetsp:Transcript_33386/g.76278  ORF Transcript_33386/g.76278 Transcript_33386/m.76278 type:complete len:219 (+) Transcript_33386:531-1187(+)
MQCVTAHIQESDAVRLDYLLGDGALTTELQNMIQLPESRAASPVAAAAPSADWPDEYLVPSPLCEDDGYTFDSESSLPAELLRSACPEAVPPQFSFAVSTRTAHFQLSSRVDHVALKSAIPELKYTPRTEGSTAQRMKNQAILSLPYSTAPGGTVCIFSNGKVKVVGYKTAADVVAAADTVVDHFLSVVGVCCVAMAVSLCRRAEGARNLFGLSVASV